MFVARSTQHKWGRGGHFLRRPSMTPHPRGLIAALAMSVLVCSPTASPAHPTESAPIQPAASALSAEAAEAAATVDAFHSAVKAGDVVHAAALLDEEIVVFEAGGAERSKAAYVAEHLAADAKFEGAATATVRRRVGAAAGGTAWIATEGRVQGRSGEKVIDRLTTETMVLRRTPAGWRIVHVHWSSHASPTAPGAR
jgi:ketosteroid isomerase-like protein